MALKNVAGLFLCLTAARVALAGVYRANRQPQTAGCKSCLFARLSRAVEFVKKNKERKLAENLWYALWHTTSFLLGVRVLLGEGWARELWSTGKLDLFWGPSSVEKAAGLPGYPDYAISHSLKQFYELEMAFWLSCAAFLAFEKRRDDFYAMLLHHIVTIFLVVGSYISKHWRIGLVVETTHDFADVFLYTAKAMHYTKMAPVVVDYAFVAFVLSFVASRLVFFPLYCVRAGLTNVMYYREEDGQPVLLGDAPGGQVLPLMLCVLQALHIYWMWLILRMINRTLRGTRVSDDGDIRSDSETEGEDGSASGRTQHASRNQAGAPVEKRRRRRA